MFGSAIVVPGWLITIARLISFVLGASLVTAWAAMVLWTYQDMRLRSRDVFAQLMAVVLVAMLGVFGLIVHLILRPRQTRAEVEERELEVHTLKRLAQRPTCAECHRAIRPDWNVCPRCQTVLTTNCQQCGHVIQRQWKACPFCGHETQTTSKAAFITSLLKGPRPAEPYFTPSNPPGGEPLAP